MNQIGRHSKHDHIIIQSFHMQHAHLSYMSNIPQFVCSRLNSPRGRLWYQVVTPQFRPSWTRPNCSIILESYSLEYSSGHTANADLNPRGGLRRRTHKLNSQCILIQSINRRALKFGLLLCMTCKYDEHSELQKKQVPLQLRGWMLIAWANSYYLVPVSNYIA